MFLIVNREGECWQPSDQIHPNIVNGSFANENDWQTSAATNDIFHWNTVRVALIQPNHVKLLLYFAHYFGSTWIPTCMRQRRWMHCCTCKAEPAEIGCKREKFGVFEMEIYFNLDPLSPFESVGFTNEQTKLMWLWTWRANDSTIKSFHSRQFYLLRSLIVLCASHRIQHSKGCCRLWKQSECERCSSSHSINKLRKDGVRRSRAAWIYHLMGDKPSRKSLLTHFAISLSLSLPVMCWTGFNRMNIRKSEAYMFDLWAAAWHTTQYFNIEFLLFCSIFAIVACLPAK